jgi:hypothetical protein
MNGEAAALTGGPLRESLGTLDIGHLLVPEPTALELTISDDTDIWDIVVPAYFQRRGWSSPPAQLRRGDEVAFDWIGDFYPMDIFARVSFGSDGRALFEADPPAEGEPLVFVIPSDIQTGEATFILQATLRIDRGNWTPDQPPILPAGARCDGVECIVNDPTIRREFAVTVVP